MYQKNVKIKAKTKIMQNQKKLLCLYQSSIDDGIDRRPPAPPGGA